MDDWDVLNDPTPPDRHWTTANIGEALPGVLTPLGWSIWGRTIERTTRQTWHAVGAISRAEAQLPPRGERITQIFHGRAALHVEALAQLGDRMPGTTGEQVVSGIFGEAPEDLSYAPSKRRYPRIAAGISYQLLRIPGKLKPAVAATQPWYHQNLDQLPEQDLSGTLAIFEDALDVFQRNVLLQTVTLFCAVQPMYDALTRLTARTGVGDPAALAGGYGDLPETAVVRDLWLASRGTLDMAEVVRRHGYHGPWEGELSSRVWREDPAPLLRLCDDYAAFDADADPRRRDAARQAERITLERKLIDASPRPARPGVKMLLRRAAITLPLRGAAKNAFLQAFDVIRASARRSGELLVADGVLADPEDVFHLTDEELMDCPGPGVRDLVERRRRRRERYLDERLPEAWTGAPVAIPVDAPDPFAERPTLLGGTGVSPGVVVGRVRVVTDPAVADVEPGEILVASTTDPSWSSMMFISAGLVVDIGGAMSHAAVVARELGIPCVVNTRDGSRMLRTGDRVRVDGREGTVRVLTPAS